MQTASVSDTPFNARAGRQRRYVARLGIRRLAYGREGLTSPGLRSDFGQNRPPAYPHPYRRSGDHIQQPRPGWQFTASNAMPTPAMGGKSPRDYLIR